MSSEARFASDLDLSQPRIGAVASTPRSAHERADQHWVLAGAYPAPGRQAIGGPANNVAARCFDQNQRRSRDAIAAVGLGAVGRPVGIRQ